MHIHELTTLFPVYIRTLLPFGKKEKILNYKIIVTSERSAVNPYFYLEKAELL